MLLRPAAGRPVHFVPVKYACDFLLSAIAPKVLIFSFQGEHQGFLDCLNKAGISISCSKEPEETE
jgi:hypothetical protein